MRETSTLQSSSRTVNGTLTVEKLPTPENELVRYCPMSMRIFWLSGATAQPPFTSSPRRCTLPPSITTVCADAGQAIARVCGGIERFEIRDPIWTGRQQRGVDVRGQGENGDQIVFGKAVHSEPPPEEITRRERFP